MKIASPVGSDSGSLANGVSRFSRLFSCQVKALPDAVTIVPNVSLAITFDHGSGVSRSPSRDTKYSRPSVVNPPYPFGIIMGGSGTGSAAGSGDARGVSIGKSWSLYN